MELTIQNWLQLQCRSSAHIKSALVVLGTPRGGDYRVEASWPETQPATPKLVSVAEQLVRREQRKPWAKTLAADEGAIVACPILADELYIGLAVVHIDSGDTLLQRKIARALQWGCEWFAWLDAERNSLREQHERLRGFIEVLSSALKFEDFRQTVQFIADGLCERIGCFRVGIGMMENGQVRRMALSGSRSDKSPLAVVSLIQAAMEEAAQQCATVCLEQQRSDGDVVVHAHRKLLGEHHLQAVCSIPMLHNGEVVAAINVEYTDAGLDRSILQFCEQVAELLAPILAPWARSPRYARGFRLVSR